MITRLLGEAISGYQTEDETNGAGSLGGEFSLGLVSQREKVALGFELNVGGDFLSKTNHKKRSIAMKNTSVNDETDDLLLVTSKRILDTNLLFSIGPKNRDHFLLLGFGAGIWRDEIKVVNFNNNGKSGYLAGNDGKKLTPNLGPTETRLDYRRAAQESTKRHAVDTKEAIGSNPKLTPAIVGGIGFNSVIGSNIGYKHVFSVRMLYKYYLLSNKVRVIAYDEKIKSRNIQITYDKFRHRDLSLSCGYRFYFD